MSQLGTVGFIIVITNFLCSYIGFKDFTFFERYKFQISKIRIDKNYVRMLSSGFLHVNWSHLLFNMFSFYSFASIIERGIGSTYFSLIYFISLLGGNFFALVIHKNRPKYSAVGASGAVSGIIFAAIALFPEIRISLLFIPIGIPSWLFGLLFISYTIYGIKSNRDTIGHEAHLGGAVLGMLTSILLYPNVIIVNFIPIALTLAPTFIFLSVFVFKTNNRFSNSSFVQTFKRNPDDQNELKKK